MQRIMSPRAPVPQGVLPTSSSPYRHTQTGETPAGHFSAICRPPLRQRPVEVTSPSGDLHAFAEDPVASANNVTASDFGHDADRLPPGFTCLLEQLKPCRNVAFAICSFRRLSILALKTNPDELVFPTHIESSARIGAGPARRPCA